MKGLKYIAVLLLVNIMILIGHSLVPHHHHMASVTHPSSHECPQSDHEHHNEDASSKYCHAFNDITFVKYNFARLPLPEKLTAFMIMTDPGILPGISPGPASAVRHDLNQIFPPLQLTGTHSLRGPPVLG